MKVAAILPVDKEKIMQKEKIVENRMIRCKCNLDVCECTYKVGKKEVTREINRLYSMGSDEVFSVLPVSLPLEKTEFFPDELYVELLGTNSIRIRNTEGHEYGTIIEVRNENGQWAPLSGVQSIKIEASVTQQMPKITVERYISNDKKI